MTEKPKTNSNKKKARRKKKAGLNIGLRHILIGAGFLLIGLFVVGYALKEITEHAKFITVNALNILVLVAIAVQALIYRQQREIMEKAADYSKIGDRAYIGIAGVALEKFNVGNRPTLRIMFLNGGRTPAWNVSLGVKFRVGSELPAERPIIHSESNLLPAGVQQDMRALMPIPITTELLTKITKGPETILVRGEIHFKDAWNNKRVFRFNLAYDPTTTAFRNYNENQKNPNKTKEGHPQVDP